MISNGTLATQKKCIGTLESIGYKVKCAKLESPAIIVVGNVVSLNDQLDFFEKRPLFGRKITVPYIEAMGERTHFNKLITDLQQLGADVDTDIPDRIKDGYGLNKMLIDRALDDGIDTIITCDNGIAAAEEITYGRKNGLTVIVTDHHQVPFVEINKEREYLLPQADAVVDPSVRIVSILLKICAGQRSHIS